MTIEEALVCLLVDLWKMAATVILSTLDAFVIAFRSNVVSNSQQLAYAA